MITPTSTSLGPSADSEITWLLHRAAQRMRSATGKQVEKHGIQLRDYIVLSALDKTPNLTQVELAKALMKCSRRVTLVPPPGGSPG